MSVGRVVTVASRVAPKLRARRAAVEMTPSAVHRLKELLKESPEQKAFRIGVKTRGCNGMSFTLDFQKEEPEKFDEIVEKEGVKLVVDSKAMMHVIGTKMDFVEDRLRSEFVFENPNATGVCGCGESFSV